MSNVYRGTLLALAGTISFNGRTLDATDLGNLTRMFNGNGAREVGKAPKPVGQRGKAASIWEFDATLIGNITAGATPIAVVAETVTEAASTSVEASSESATNDTSTVAETVAETVETVTSESTEVEPVAELAEAA